VHANEDYYDKLDYLQEFEKRKTDKCNAVNWTFWKHFCRLVWIAISILVLLEAVTIGQAYLNGEVMNAIGGILGYIVIASLSIFDESQTCDLPTVFCSPSATCQDFCDAGFQTAKDAIWGQKYKGICPTCATEVPIALTMTGFPDTLWSEDFVEGQITGTVGLMYWYMVWAGVIILLAVCILSLGELLSIRLRVNITSYFHQRILLDKYLYELVITNKVVDNYDQRITDDVIVVLTSGLGILVGNIYFSQPSIIFSGPPFLPSSTPMKESWTRTTLT
jgi:ABC-type uncharacterized transport system fused permease/ATPase subunit